MENKASNSANISSSQIAGIYKSGLKGAGEIKKKGGIKLNGIFTNPVINEKPLLTIQNASGRNIFTIVKDAF